MAKERDYQAGLIKRLENIFPGCMVLKNDANYRQGIPDLLILFKDRWAALEVKQSAKAKKRPNQDYYVNQMNDMSYASFISPDNEVEILDEIQRALQPTRKARVSKSK